ncbi:MAG: phosphopantetheine-binding protein [Alistipes sp.]|jgi:acyl carrier protein|nr:acyl carrier protein [Alistipes sp.]MDO5497082.1 phosphopantetheine-binding protein [Alistipes sp.]
MTIEEIIEKAIAVLADEFEVDASTITPEASLKETLDLDSLDLVDVVVLVEQNFGVTLTGPDFVGVETFQDFFEMLNRKING